MNILPSLNEQIAAAVRPLFQQDSNVYQACQGNEDNLPRIAAQALVEWARAHAKED